ncbi:uncharacterized protein LOC114785206 [Denticeps clupeoides]|uniref:uncharacterized protein LOC114785206 n=1 Tax=Denticeps clupeoides TaxID=299321 RepID=UPI0010A2AEC0|nr:uncharacterized protein LOC114785206 [Denticeps clupeoides]
MKKDLQAAYQLAESVAGKRNDANKQQYDQRVRYCPLAPGDRVLIRNVGLQGKHKLADRWSSTPYVIESQMPGLPVFKLKPEHRDGPKKVLHRNLILPIGQDVRLSAEETKVSAPKKRQSKRLKAKKATVPEVLEEESINNVDEGSDSEEDDMQVYTYQYSQPVTYGNSGERTEPFSLDLGIDQPAETFTLDPQHDESQSSWLSNQGPEESDNGPREPENGVIMDIRIFSVVSVMKFRKLKRHHLDSERESIQFDCATESMDQRLDEGRNESKLDLPNMNPVCYIYVFILSASSVMSSVRSLPGVSTIDCKFGSDGWVGEVSEGYTGDVEILSGIPTDDTVDLVPHLFPTGVTFLELVYTPGGTTATVRTSKELDAEALNETDGKLYYSVECVKEKKTNSRSLILYDVNDNAPVFQQKEYEVVVSEVLAVGSSVVKLSAVDADISPTNNRVNYSILPPVPSPFQVRSDGFVILKQPLNYNIDHHYAFIAHAQDVEGLSDTANVSIEIEDSDNMNPYFDHGLYYAVIDENKVGSFKSILPAPIKAQDGDLGINQTIIYSITGVIPSEYLPNFYIDAASGAISVLTAFEKISTVSVQLKASQEDDSFKTATALLTVTVEDSTTSISSTDAVIISLNVPIHVVLDSVNQLERSLERGLGWAVKIIGLTSGNQNDHPPSPITFVRFVAVRNSGSGTIPMVEVINKLQSEKEELLLGLQQLYGPDVEFEVISVPGKGTKTLEIVLGVVLPAVVVVIFVFIVRRLSVSGDRPNFLLYRRL